MEGGTAAAADTFYGTDPSQQKVDALFSFFRETTVGFNDLQERLQRLVPVDADGNPVGTIFKVRLLATFATFARVMNPPPDRVTGSHMNFGLQSDEDRVSRPLARRAFLLVA